MRTTKQYFFIGLFIILGLFPLYSQNYDIYENNTYDNVSIFLIKPSDKYYTGWLDRRGMITTLNFNYNFNLEETFRKRDPDYDFDFNDVFTFVDARIAKEIQFYRNPYFSVGFAGAISASIFEKEQTINSVNFYTYDFAGEFAAYIDVYFQELLSTNLKLRIYPMYHHSTHFVDGYKSNFAQMGASFEFFGLSAHYYKNFNNHFFSPYAGIETTYRYAGNGAPAFKVHAGSDYRFLFLKQYDMSIIVGFNIAYIRDNIDLEQLITNQDHLAVAAGTGIEFHNFILAAKYKYERGRGATNYFQHQNTLGIEMSVFF